MACLRFLILCLPERLWCISVRTDSLALRLYLRPRELSLERDREPRDEDRDLDLEDDLRAGMRTSGTVRRTTATHGCAQDLLHPVDKTTGRIAARSVSRQRSAPPRRTFFTDAAANREA